MIQLIPICNFDKPFVPWLIIIRHVYAYIGSLFHDKYTSVIETVDFKPWR